MRLKQISKMRNQKWTTDKWQLQNQIILKIIVYTHICIHSWAKSKETNKNKVQETDMVNKRNKRLYLPVKNKTKAQTGKQY